MAKHFVKFLNTEIFSAASLSRGNFPSCLPLRLLTFGAVGTGSKRCVVQACLLGALFGTIQHRFSFL